jgi:uncharacterized protein (TIGR02266 family)
VRKFSITFSEKYEFLEVFLGDIPGGGIFVRAEDEYSVGESVAVHLCFREIPEGVSLGGKVVWRRAPAKWRSALVPGLGVQFDDSERTRVEFLTDFCRGQLSAKRKSEERIPTDIPIEYCFAGNWIKGRVRDISRGGLFIVTDNFIPPNTSVDMNLFSSKFGKPDRITGEVAWMRTNGPETGVGVRFELQSPTRRRRVEKLVDQIRDRFI